MFNSNCPHCDTTIKGKSIFTIVQTNSGVKCPSCQSTLIVLPNYWQMGSYVVAILTILARLLVDINTHPSLSLALIYMTSGAFLFAIFALLYLPRYRLAKYQPVNNVKFKCDSCHCLLPTADSVCTSCDKKLIHSAFTFEQDKFFTPLHNLGGICPVCNNHSQRFDSILIPEKAPWYKFQKDAPRCPVCKTILRRKYETKAFKQIYVSLWLTFLFLQFLPKSSLWFLINFVALCISASLLAINTFRRMRDPVKYVPDESALTTHASRTGENLF